MARSRVLVATVMSLIVAGGPGLATTLEEQYIANPGWCPGLVGPLVQDEHDQWHMIGFGATQGREFVEFHREFLAQSDDYRIFGIDTPGADVDPDPAAIPVVARPGVTLKHAHTSLNGYTRPAAHAIDPPHPHPGFGVQSFWVPRPATLRLGNAAFHAFTANGVGGALDGLFHGNGHVSIGAHDQVPLGAAGDMLSTMNATRDGAFYQWHKNIDNIYSDWAVGQYQLAAKTGLPIYFSALSTAVGAAGSSIAERRLAAVYQGSNPAVASQYGASPRIGSDVYVANMNGSNLLYAYGVRSWNTLNAWDIDAWTILNPPAAGWYFSVTAGSTGAAGSAVLAQAVKGGDVFETGGGTNLLFRTEAILGLAAAGTDDLDALEVDEQKRVQGTNDNGRPGIFDRPKQWFSLRSGSTFGVTASGGALVDAGDIVQFNANGDLVIAVDGSVLGLGAADELDALAIVDADASDTLTAADRIYYSLAAGSPALGANSAADIFCHTVAGATCGAIAGRLEATAAGLGLLAADDLDGLDVKIVPSGQGACCRPAGTCTVETAASCNVGGGSFAGPETVCSASECPSAPGACCDRFGSCTQLSDLACLEALGTFRGAGVACAGVACPAAPPNDDCNNAYPIPYDYDVTYQPPDAYTNNTYATADPYDPAYGCADHEVFFPPYGSGTIWYSYDVPPGGTRSIALTTTGTAQYQRFGGYAGDTRLAVYYAPGGNCSTLQEVACGDNYSFCGAGAGLDNYAYVQYDDPNPGRYYVQLATVGDVYRGQIQLRRYVQAAVPAVSGWGLAVLSLLLVGGAVLLLRRRRAVRA